MCKGNGPNSCQHLDWGCTQSTLTLHSHTQLHTYIQHALIGTRAREWEWERKSARAESCCPFCLPILQSFLSLFASLCCSSRRWQRFTVAHFTRLHNFNTVHKLSLLTKLLSSDVGSDVNGGSSACLQFVGSHKARQRGQCSRADRMKGGRNKKE